jgi:hypothetical protein
MVSTWEWLILSVLIETWLKLLGRSGLGEQTGTLRLRLPKNRVTSPIVGWLSKNEGSVSTSRSSEKAPAMVSDNSESTPTSAKATSSLSSDSGMSLWAAMILKALKARSSLCARLGCLDGSIGLSAIAFMTGTVTTAFNAVRSGR